MGKPNYAPHSLPKATERSLPLDDNFTHIRTQKKQNAAKKDKLFVMTFGILSNQQAYKHRQKNNPVIKYASSIRSFYQAKHHLCRQTLTVTEWSVFQIMMLRYIVEEKGHITSGWCLSGFLL